MCVCVSVCSVERWEVRALIHLDRVSLCAWTNGQSKQLKKKKKEEDKEQAHKQMVREKRKRIDKMGQRHVIQKISLAEFQ